MILAVEPQVSNVYFSSYAQGPFLHANHLICVRNIALHGKDTAL